MKESDAQRTSFLAVLALLAAIVALFTAVGAHATYWIFSHGSLFEEVGSRTLRIGLAAASIVGIATVVPGLIALVLGLAAGAGIRESGGLVRGAALSRVAILAALLASIAGGLTASRAAQARDREKTEDAQSDVDRFHAVIIHRLRGNADGVNSQYYGDVRDAAQLSISVQSLEAYRLSEVIDPREVRVLTVGQALAEMKGRLPVEAALRAGARHEDRVVFAPIRVPEGLTKPQISEAFFGDEKAEYVCFVFNRHGRIIHPAPDVSYDRTRPSRGRSQQEQWYGCDRCWRAQAAAGKCSSCGRPLTPFQARSWR